jgi:hypothetical protein
MSRPDLTSMMRTEYAVESPMLNEESAVQISMVVGRPRSLRRLTWSSTATVRSEHPDTIASAGAAIVQRRS